MTAAKAKAPTRWAREYETIYILRSNVVAEDAEKVGTRVADVIARLGGHLTQVDHWGRRQLAYKINKQSRGIFVYVKYVAFNDAVAELERNLRLMDDVIRYQTIVLRDRIDPSTVEVDPEAVKFEAIEDDEEPYEEESLASRLGMSRLEPRSAEGYEGATAGVAESDGDASDGDDATDGEDESGEDESGEDESPADADDDADEEV